MQPVPDVIIVSRENRKHYNDYLMFSFWHAPSVHQQQNKWKTSSLNS